MTVNMKKIAAERAVEEYVRDGMNVGLGTGSTAFYVICKVGELVAAGMNLTCVATSEETERIAKDLGIRVVNLSEVNNLDVTIDGADEVTRQLHLIKGLGGALVREKIVAASSIDQIVVVDESKLVESLGKECPLPVEVMVFGHEKTKRMIERQGCKATLRMRDGEPFMTDNGNYIYDCKFDGIANPYFLESRLDTIPGVVENGLFLNMTAAAFVARSDGTVEKIC
jgi:ribose 5-phosphate isomerase A